MPRPTTTGKQASQSASSGNFISRWFSGRKERKKAAEEEAAATIINDAAKNEGAFITMLQQIRFHESKLSKDKLEYRTDPKQRYGDLELCARWLEQEIARNTSPVCLDIRPLDQKIYQIIARYKEAIELGYTDTAFAARAALLDVLPKIRFRLPQVLPAGIENDYARSYIERCSEHAETWVNLLTQTLDADKTYEAILRVEAELEKKTQVHEERLDAFAKMLQENSDKLADYMAVQSADSDSQLTPSQKQLRNDMIEVHVQTAVFTVYQKQAEQLKQIRTVCSGRVEALKAAIKSLVIPTDPNSLNKYKDEIQKMRETMAARDQEIEESLKDFEDLQGAMEAMDDLPGAVHARQSAANAVMKLIDDVKLRQEQRLKAPVSGQLLMDIYGIKSEEEMKQIEIQRQKEIEMLKNMASLNVGNDEREVLYN